MLLATFSQAHAGTPPAQPIEPLTERAEIGDEPQISLSDEEARGTQSGRDRHVAYATDHVKT